MTLAVFSLEINFPVVKERLKISVSMEEISFKRKCRTLLNMLNGPVDLCGSIFFMKATISSGLIGVKKKEFWPPHVIAKVFSSERDILFYF